MVPIRTRLCVPFGRCRYPTNPSNDWNSLPPISQDPELFAAGNAGSIEDLLEWCKDDMPSRPKTQCEHSR